MMNRSAASSRRIPPSGGSDEPANIRLVAIDLDGTLLNDSKQVSDRTAAALSGLPQKGVKVIIASARPPRSVRHIYRQLKLDTWQINYNGALIWDEPAGKPIFHQPMPGELVLRIVELSRSLGDIAVVSCEILDRWFTDRIDPHYLTETARLFGPDVIAPIHEICNQPITKLLLHGQPDLISKLESVLPGVFPNTISLVRTEPHLLQITDRNVSKAAALKTVAQHYNVPAKNIMAIGDAANDLAMLKMSGVAVAMDNAVASLKKIADWVAPSNNDHGVHAALVKYGLC